MSDNDITPYRLDPNAERDRERERMDRIVTIRALLIEAGALVFLLYFAWLLLEVAVLRRECRLTPSGFARGGRYDRSPRASSHNCRAMMPAGSARANLAACPAHSCIRSASPVCCADFRIAEVSPR